MEVHVDLTNGLHLHLTEEREKKLSKGEVPVTRATKRSCHHLLVGELIGEECIFDEQYHCVVSNDGHKDQENCTCEES